MTKAIDPIAFQLGPLSVHWYGIILGTAALVGLLLALREAKQVGMDPETIMDVVMYAVPAAIIGARIYYVIFRWDEYYRSHPEEIIAVWHGGIAIHGALIASILTAYIYSRIKKISFWRLVDVVAPSLIIGQAIGRWGNFINQEAHGGPVSLEFLQNLHLPQFIINQMYIFDPVTNTYSYYHPTFLYESLWNLLGFILLITIRRLLPLKRGDLFLTYVIWYSIGRFFVEGMRTDSLMLTETLRMAQVISLLLIAFALIMMVVLRKMGYATKRYGEA
ncbi:MULTISPECIES: prolipoprotein diacylglyceryl transferase [Aneurinibacillus]|uniref:Phosphatidylglycerol--prolipoprotein diacylglyceryl transferase n=1 Tax=Aneurinibacillus thermoaerophilus TaxID=143495 RepID=A0A1G8E9X2_ANETH|nr:MULTISPECIES: prolipoprotein diacylglyceryl transferase [Aneurinibacillus]AMA71771.1 prolipoprotein diacylglyceryl transferase [Aneurinibacillus sp. XH2]MED0676898.1 prolipoprotein diacylglyceryl transferase [Aneurinibacillus thermoaerophilus]MED0680743.1 prolipoprotein diacylglyceryl transferase [Aneurinibacillus thermoaerophilus]MED0738766.1 prolipoprotein diacylglyceryl transferase [Aneurinibacillus thermoaerophilus]MED0758015.1 prolipoprotein diacylglyceryl transferase [Aneurinibacillus